MIRNVISVKGRASKNIFLGTSRSYIGGEGGGGEGGIENTGGGEKTKKRELKRKGVVLGGVWGIPGYPLRPR